MNADSDWCTTIKNRGIRIAILYTPYVPIPSSNAANGWYDNFDSSGNGIDWMLSPNTDQAAAALQTCASPGLYYEAASDSQISQDLAALFQQAVTTAHLSK
jgi:hypothetical protein